MLNFFRNNKLSASFLVTLYAVPFILSHYQTFKNSKQTITELPFLFKSLPAWLTESFVLKESLLIIILFILSFWLNRIVNFNRLGKKNTYITAISFFIVFFVFPDFDIFSTALIASLFCLASIDQLFLAYEKKVSVSEVFNAAFLNSMAVLLYPAAVFLFIFLLIAWLILRTFNTKEFVILLSGFAIPLYLCATLYYMNNQLSEWLIHDFWERLGISNFNIELNFTFWIGLINFSLLTIFTIFNLNNLKTKTTIREQKYINVLFVLLLNSFLILIFQKNFTGSSLLFTALPLGIFLSLNLQSLKNERLAEIFHLYLWISVIFVQYYQFLFR